MTRTEEAQAIIAQGQSAKCTMYAMRALQNRDIKEAEHWQASSTYYSQTARDYMGLEATE